MGNLFSAASAMYGLDLYFCFIDFMILFTDLMLFLSSYTGPEVIKLFPCAAQLSMKFFLLINVKMPTIVGILTFMSWKNSIISSSEP